jgi:hypothetical protein
MKFEPLQHRPQVLTIDEWSNMFHNKDKELGKRLDRISLALEYLKTRTEEEEEQEVIEEYRPQIKPISFKTAFKIVLALHLLVGAYIFTKPAKAKQPKTPQPITQYRK